MDLQASIARIAFQRHISRGYQSQTHSRCVLQPISVFRRLACSGKRSTLVSINSLVNSNPLPTKLEREEESIDMIHGLCWIYPSATTLEHIMRAMSRYADFLTLFASGNAKSLQPALNIDFIWHTHQLNCDAYRYVRDHFSRNHHSRRNASGMTCSTTSEPFQIMIHPFGQRTHVRLHSICCPSFSTNVTQGYAYDSVIYNWEVGFCGFSWRQVLILESPGNAW